MTVASPDDMINAFLPHYWSSMYIEDGKDSGVCRQSGMLGMNFSWNKRFQPPPMSTCDPHYEGLIIALRATLNMH